MKPSHKVLSNGKFVSYILLWITCFYGAYQLWILLDYFKVYPATEYITHVGELLPAEAIVKLAMYNRLVQTIWFGLLVVLVYFYLDYKSNPKTHFFTKIQNWFVQFTEDINEKEGNNAKERTCEEDKKR